ncbi:universal stress protein [Halobacteriales archaeon Cl-PHB]
MTNYLVATDSVECSDVLADYLTDWVTDDDTVYAVTSLRGGDANEAEDHRRAETAVERVAERLGDRTTVETHQYVRGNAPSEDVLQAAAEFDVSILVIGLQRHSRTERVIFGSTLEATLHHVDRPVWTVPV